ncbi:hypothetical protein GCM10012285_40340 [Streptomyces kronopolitis]|uniref:Uncharacterized protein n=1 Tax=Streptomyces kronopolitis TaxID=1612435 RepID=A0ABQ2JPA9_9ACTN|nr:hypothetical protein GCM10012285_40340 [Streptomyces kronopolitis]
MGGADGAGDGSGERRDGSGRPEPRAARMLGGKRPGRRVFEHSFGRTTRRGPGPGIVCRAPGRAGCCCRASGTIRVRTAAYARTAQIVANALSRMSRPSPSRSSPMTSGGRKRSTLP